MQQLLILSGKGGTGKTSITSALASLAPNNVFVDCDVDAADLYIIFQPENYAQHNFAGGELAKVDTGKCIQCGRCVYSCRFEAIKETDKGIIINPYHCEGCRVCTHICPTQAVYMEPNMDNQWFVGKTRFGKLVHARLAPGEDNSGKLVSRIREESQKIAKEENSEYIIIDGPPGIGCPVISSISGVNKVLIVTEPSVSGLHDLKRVLELLKKLDKQNFVVINKYDLNKQKCKEVEEYCQQNNVEVIEKIPFDKSFTQAMIEKKNIIEYAPDSELSKKITTIWEKISSYA